MGQLLGPDFPSDIALAVSGGGDSMAMLTLAHNWTRVWGVRLWVVTVDHGLRPESADEAAFVAEEVRALGHPHATLRWHWDGQGNVQDAARHARLSLIDRWRAGLDHVLMAHTQDDVAETFLMRLKRGSGVDGLSAMRARRRVVPHVGTPPALPDADVTQTQAPPMRGAAATPGFDVIRPCLDMRRAELRHYLRTLKGRWVEDPSNDDPAFGRVQMRQALSVLEEAGLSVASLTRTADRMRRASDALRARAVEAWRALQPEDAGQMHRTGDVSFDRTGFERVEPETQLRLLAAALQYVSTNAYRPRADPLQAVLERVLAGGAGTLHGCEVRADGAQLRILREFQAVAALQTRAGDARLWDGRWQVVNPDMQGLTVRALGEDGWAQCPDRGVDTPAFHAARALPSIWDGAKLVACDAMGVGPGGTMRLCPMGRDLPGFEGFLLSH
ncbi:tRNA lysidine(34) synthetase TilS [Thalassococcus sp. BH17M4-6]|uniref:tRNA lysidine(34) synthetase TilS n=1 Tax=Thalassococcus sp. BH17M4-6 TaxID=3413148 RepID=UPI003BDDA7D9